MTFFYLLDILEWRKIFNLSIVDLLWNLLFILYKKIKKAGFFFIYNGLVLFIWNYDKLYGSSAKIYRKWNKIQDTSSSSSSSSSEDEDEKNEPNKTTESTAICSKQVVLRSAAAEEQTTVLKCEAVQSSKSKKKKKSKK